MRTSRLRKIALGVGAATLSVALVGVASPAHAAAVGCTVALGGSSCNSSSLAANSSGHYVNYWVMGGTAPCFSADWKIYDISNNVTVKSGHVGSGSTSGTVYGLYGSYKIRIYNSCWDAEADMSN